VSTFPRSKLNPVPFPIYNFLSVELLYSILAVPPVLFSNSAIMGKAIQVVKKCPAFMEPTKN
jgi:hypothetical protein